MFKNSSLAAVTLIALVFGASLANAHPKPQSVEPAAGRASVAPKQIRITFNENVLPQFSGLELKDQTGRSIPTETATTDPTNKKVLVVPLKEELAPGDYKVEWHAVSGDTHRVTGNYSFSVVR